MSVCHDFFTFIETIYVDNFIFMVYNYLVYNFSP